MLAVNAKAEKNPACTCAAHKRIMRRHRGMDYKIKICPADISNKLHEAGKLGEKDVIIMLIEDWVLIEHKESERLIYKAVNIYNYVDIKLSCRKKAILPVEYRKFAERISKLQNYRGAALEIGKDERALQLLNFIFDSVLPKHSLSLREGQKAISQLMLKSLQHSRLALCEAEVGTGKTHAYLIAAVVYNLFAAQKKTIVISTSTIALQEAIVKEYIPKLSYILRTHRIIEKPLSYIIRKGKTHYVCDMRLQTYESSLENLGQDILLMDKLQELRKTNYLHIDLDKISLSPYVKNRINVHRCTVKCPMYFSCRYMTLIRKSKEQYHDFLIVNHNYVFAEVLGVKNGLEKKFPDYGIIVLDEAHKIKDVARQMYSIVLEVNMMADLIGDIKPDNFEKNSVRKEISAICNSLMISSNELIEHMSMDVINNHERDIHYGNFKDEIATQILLKEISFQIRTIQDFYAGGEKRSNNSIYRKCVEILIKLEAVTDTYNNIVWVEQAENGSLRLCALPKGLEKSLYRDFWNTDVKKIVTSGTLSVKGDFSHFKMTTGINYMQPAKTRVLEISRTSPFDFRNHAIMYIPERMPFPDIKNINYINTIKKEIVELIYATYGHTLILFTSYRLMEMLFYLIKEESVPFPLFMMGRGRLDALESYKDSRNGVLFASDSAGEGIDLPGDILSSLIIVKLPFPIPDPVMRYEQLAYKDFRNYIDAVIIPEMLLKLRQWIGRGIRNETDTTAFTILDCRAGLHGRYRQNILDALPGMPVTDRIHDIYRFIKEKKDENYFKRQDEDERNN